MSKEKKKTIKAQEILLKATKGPSDNLNINLNYHSIMALAKDIKPANNQLSKNLYLYGKEEVPEIPEEIIQQRINILQLNLKDILNISWEKRDDERANKIIKAIEFWENINKK